VREAGGRGGEEKEGREENLRGTEVCGAHGLPDSPQTVAIVAPNSANRPENSTSRALAADGPLTARRRVRHDGGVQSLLDKWFSTSFWRFNLAIWCIFGAFEFVVRYVTLLDPWRALWLTLLQEPMAFGLSALLYLVYRRPQLSDPFRFRTAVWMVGLSVAAALVQSAISRGFVELTGWHTPTWTPREEWLFRIIFISLVYLTWSLVFFGLKTRASARTAAERAELAREQAQRMELQLLRAQLDPHFLFNSLNGIASEIPNRPDAALEMVHELSDYLRYSLDHRHKLLAPLSSELDAVAAYLRIEQARFGERLEASVEAEVDARRRLVPSFLLQPLVENATKHGLQEEHCKLEIYAGCEGDELSISVRNPGRLPEELEVVEGVGLETLRRRLAFHYPGRWEFELSQMNGVVTAEVKLRGEPCSA
jgi:sensor histidine kinase YesM